MAGYSQPRWTHAIHEAGGACRSPGHRPTRRAVLPAACAFAGAALLVCTGSTFSAASSAFSQLVAPAGLGGLAGSTAIWSHDGSVVPRPHVALHAGKGFNEYKPKIKRKRVPLATLKEQHGNMAEEVEKVLLGDKASSAEVMMRARYSAVLAKDAIFMAKSERDKKDKPMNLRVRDWAVIFGREERTDEDKHLLPAAKMLSEIRGYELVEAKGNEVEYKIGVEGGQLHTREIYEEDNDMGFIFTGKSVFEKFEDDESAETGASS